MATSIKKSDPSTWAHSQEITNEACLKCRLHEHCKNPILDQATDSRYNQHKNYNRVLVVGDYPAQMDSQQGLYYGRNFAQFRDRYLNGLEGVAWDFTTVVRCSTESDSKKPTPTQQKHCAGSFLREQIIKQKPRIVVCLGVDAFRAATADWDRAVLPQEYGHVWKDTEIGVAFILAHHPMGKELRGNEAKSDSHYMMIFNAVEKVYAAQPNREVVNYELVRDPARARAIAHMKYNHAFVDFETNYPIFDKTGYRDLSRNTIWKEGTEVVSMSLTFYDESVRAYRNYVFAEKVFEDHWAVRNLIEGRTLYAWNLPFEASVFWAKFNIWIWDVCKAHPHKMNRFSDKPCHDPMMMYHLGDQNRVNNSLKTVIKKFFNDVDDWDKIAYSQLVEAAKRLQRCRLAKEAEFKALRKDMETFRFCAEKQKDIMTASEAKKWKEKWESVKHYKNSTNLQSLIGNLQEEINRMPVPGLVSYADVPIIDCAQYNAEDTYHPHRWLRDIMPELERIEGFTFNLECYEMLLDTIELTMEITREGLTIDLDRLDQFEADHKKLEREEMKKLLKIEEVQQALQVDPKFIKAQKDGVKPPFRKIFNSKGGKFQNELAKLLGVYDFGKLTKATPKTGMRSFAKDAWGPIISWAKEQCDKKVLDTYTSMMLNSESTSLRSKVNVNWKRFNRGNKINCSFKVFRNENLERDFKAGNRSGGTRGRLSSSAINSQQIPKISEVREIIVTPPRDEISASLARGVLGYLPDRKSDYFYCQIDFKSLEPMIMAYITGCERFKKFFNRGVDIYRGTANDVYNKGLDIDDYSKTDEEIQELFNTTISDKERKMFKVGLLMKIYGGGKKKFMHITGCSEEEVEHFWKVFPSLYPEVELYKKDLRESLARGEMQISRTLRQCSYPINKDIPRGLTKEQYQFYKDEINRLEYKAFQVAANRETQNLASDICCLAAIKIMRWAQKLGIWRTALKINNIVHDDIDFHIHREYAWIVPHLKAMMEERTFWWGSVDVPLQAEVSVGDNGAESMIDDKDGFQTKKLAELGIDLSKKYIPDFILERVA